MPNWVRAGEDVVSADYKGRALCDLSALTTFSPALESDQNPKRHPTPTQRNRSSPTKTNDEPGGLAGATARTTANPSQERARTNASRMASTGGSTPVKSRNCPKA